MGKWDDPEFRRKYQREYYREHIKDPEWKKKRIEDQRRRRNTEEYRKKSREYYKRIMSDPIRVEEKRARNRDWMRKNRERRQKWKKEYEERYREKVINLVGKKCILCNCLNRIDYHEINFKKHPTGLKYIADHSEDFVPLCRRHHECVHRLRNISLNKLLYLFKELLGHKEGNFK